MDHVWIKIDTGEDCWSYQCSRCHRFVRGTGDEKEDNILMSKAPTPCDPDREKREEMEYWNKYFSNQEEQQ